MRRCTVSFYGYLTDFFTLNALHFNRYAYEIAGKTTLHSVLYARFEFSGMSLVIPERIILLETW